MTTKGKKAAPKRRGRPRKSATAKKPLEKKSEDKPEEKAEEPEKKPEAKAEEKPMVVEEVIEAPVVKEKLPVATMIAVDPMSRVAVVALKTGSRFIGGQRYHLEEGKEVEGGILLAHLELLEEAGVVKKKA